MAGIAQEPELEFLSSEGSERGRRHRRERCRRQRRRRCCASAFATTSTQKPRTVKSWFPKAVNEPTAD